MCDDGESETFVVGHVSRVARFEVGADAAFGRPCEAELDECADGGIRRARARGRRVRPRVGGSSLAGPVAQYSAGVLAVAGAVWVVLARVGLRQQAFLSDRMIRLFAWALAAVFVVETAVAFTWNRGEELWWLYGPVSLVIAVLALVVAGTGGAWPRLNRRHRMLPSH